MKAFPQMTDSPALPTRQPAEVHATVQRLITLAVRGLEPMFDKQRQLFCHKLKQTDRGLVQEGHSQRYTMMTLMGLHRLQQAGGSSPFESESILDTLLADLGWVDNLGDLGVLLWLCALVAPERLAQLEPQLDLPTAMTRFRGAKQGVTMELAWFLTGLSYWGLACPEKLPEMERLAFDTYKALTKNRGEQGFLGHLARSGSVAGMLRGRVGSFADQVYPIYAMTQFSKAYQHQEARLFALDCALGICEAQGPLGQWWWHYDSVRGRVADGYPVFSVHQHAMGPMTLFALGETIQHDFRPWIYKGLQWINSHNELGFNLEDGASKLVWRCIYRSRRSLGRYLNTALGRSSEQIQHERPEDLNVLFECRPYELGWLLYAFAGRAEHEASVGSEGLHGAKAVLHGVALGDK